MPYTADKPDLAPSADELRARIPGWGVDLDPKDRPAVPKENFNPEGTGAHWKFPERQSETWPRERSIEHKFLPPVFGTSCPPSGLSGVVRHFAYRFSEARPAHWLLLMGADRINVVEGRVGALLHGRPDSRFLETGIRTEYTHGGLRARLGQHRADPRHVWIDALVFAAPYVALAGAAYYLTRNRPRSQRGVVRNTRAQAGAVARTNTPPRDRSAEGIGTPS